MFSMNPRKTQLLLLTFLLAFFTVNAKQYKVVNTDEPQLLGTYFEVLEDESAQLNINEVLRADGYQPSDKKVPNFGITPNVYWLRVNVLNEMKASPYLHVQYAQLDDVEFYKVQDGNVVDKLISGEQVPITERDVKKQDFFYNTKLSEGEEATIYIRVKTSEQSLVPVYIGKSRDLFNNVNFTDVLSALYFGIILVMFMYNLFVYFTVRDKSYLFYVIYILFVGLTQLGFQGYTYKLLWPSSPWLANQSVIFLPAITGIAAIEFFKHFLQIRETSKRFVLVLNILNIFYLVNIGLSVAGLHSLSQQLMQPNAMIASLVILGIGIYMMRKGSRSAGYFILAWGVFLAGIFIFIMKDLGIIPYNNFTNYILHIGSAIEVVVLSFALGDKINVLQKEKDESQKQALLALEENAKIISDQNVMLETKVKERTVELQKSNDELNKTLIDLKEAESQLVESEKMASLGQLTAGIAHEINNPINFVTSNVKPLKRDVDMLLDMINRVEEVSLAETSIDEKKSAIDSLKKDLDFDYLKQEIDYLLNGINEGSSRTAEIVKGLRVFSRLDEDALKKADINEGLDSTLIIVNNTLADNIEIVKNYGNLTAVECFPGKLNQVFLNIITNGLQAIKERHGGEAGGKLEITTLQDDGKILIKIRDNGTGMDESTKKKIFEPFFTTKDVGEGTGLGMSIVYKTIVKHNGKIDIDTEPGVGTEFTLTIPVVHVDNQIAEIG